MTRCATCDRFGARLDFGSPREYWDFVRLLIEVVGQGTFLLLEASCPLQDVFQQPWVNDTLSHDFRCTTCGRAFGLFADTYHGRANWKPGDAPSTA